MIPRLIVLLLLSAPLAAQEHDHEPRRREKLGTVRFATSCGAAAQPAFNRAVALLHSFEFGRAVDGFDAALRPTRPARWRTGASRSAAGATRSRPASRPAAQLAAGRAARSPRAQSPAAKTDRERGYVDAVAQLYADYEQQPSATRVVGVPRRDGRRWPRAIPPTRRRRSSTRCRSRSPPRRRRQDATRTS